LHLWFILLCLFLLFAHFHIVVFMSVVVLHLVVCSICCSLVFILSFCIFGLLVVVHSSSHHHLHVCSFSTISYMHSILQIFVQLFAATFNVQTFCIIFLCFFSLYLIVTFVKTTIVYQCDGHRWWTYSWISCFVDLVYAKFAFSH